MKNSTQLDSVISDSNSYVKRLISYVVFDKVHGEIDQNIKETRSVRTLDTSFVESRKGTDNTMVKLKTNAHLFDDCMLKVFFRTTYKIYLYIMQVFPKLKSVRLATRDITIARTVPSLSSEEAAEFLKYLLQIPHLYVICIPVESLEQVLMQFHHGKGILRL